MIKKRIITLYGYEDDDEDIANKYGVPSCNATLIENKG